jgi:hypothetical protein
VLDWCCYHPKTTGLIVGALLFGIAAFVFAGPLAIPLFVGLIKAGLALLAFTTTSPLVIAAVGAGVGIVGGAILGTVGGAIAEKAMAPPLSQVIFAPDYEETDPETSDDEGAIAPLHVSRSSSPAAMAAAMPPAPEAPLSAETIEAKMLELLSHVAENTSGSLDTRSPEDTKTEFMS